MDTTNLRQRRTGTGGAAIIPANKSSSEQLSSGNDDDHPKENEDEDDAASFVVEDEKNRSDDDAKSQSQPLLLQEAQRRQQDKTKLKKKEETTRFTENVNDRRNEEFSSDTTTTNNMSLLSSTTTHPYLSYHVAKWLILRTTGLVYFVAFYGAYQQNIGLMGRHGLQPAIDYWDPIYQKYTNGTGDFNLLFKGFQQYPTLFWFIQLTDQSMIVVTVIGMTISLVLVVLMQEESMILMILLWLLDFSIVTISEGTSFYQYGWESQLLETGFLSIFLCHNNTIFPSSCCSFLLNNNCVVGNNNSRLGDERRSRRSLPPEEAVSNDDDDEGHNSSCSTSSWLFSYYGTSIILYLFQWLCFRISMGAGLIKIRGDSCWTEKTCLLYHFETQPIPSPTSFVFHFLPSWMLHHAVNLDLFVQVYTSWFVLLSPLLMQQLFRFLLLRRRRRRQQQQPPPRSINTNVVVNAVYRISLWLLRLGGIIQIGFMVNIILSGNFAFLNHLTIIPALACLDDDCWPSALRSHVLGGNPPISRSLTNLQGESNASQRRANNRDKYGQLSVGAYYWARTRLIINLALFVMISKMSWPVVANLLQLEGRRQQMNASFGRFRLVNTYGAFGSVGQARYEPIVSITYKQHPAGPEDWLELEFPCKPGTITRRPCFCAPYHCEYFPNCRFSAYVL